MNVIEAKSNWWRFSEVVLKMDFFDKNQNYLGANIFLLLNCYYTQIEDTNKEQRIFLKYLGIIYKQ